MAVYLTDVYPEFIWKRARKEEQRLKLKKEEVRAEYSRERLIEKDEGN